MASERPIDALFESTAELLASEVVADAMVPVAFLNELSHASDQPSLLQAYAKWGRHLAQADRCSVALDNGDNTATKYALNGDFDAGQGMAHDLDATAVGEVMKRRQTVYLPDLAAVSLDDCKQVSEMGYAAAILAPVGNGINSFGTLAISYRTVPENVAQLAAKIQAMAQCLATQLQIIEQMASLRNMARTDALTGAGNRRLFYEQMDIAWAKWQDIGQMFCYLAIDLDHFKQINDTYGHDVGDAVLSAFARRVYGRLRQSDTLIRMGGEEFGLLLGNTDLDQATVLAKRLCDGVGDAPFAVSDMHLMVTASFGLTQVGPNDITAEDVVKRADIALYQAKTGGRDQVVVLDDAELAA
ncbi:MAG: GGDEF domain-containing protein [Pseudomonadota bacterium]